MKYLTDSVAPPALVGIVSGVASWLYNVPILGILGSCISMGWLVLGVLKYRLDRAKHVLDQKKFDAATPK